ncbi:MAG: hypothetical protein EOO67_14045 [Microbacterium sp.]|nr:MAG: hypothetical protein EOO67_14045 [Microbacterium sp.]
MSTNTAPAWDTELLSLPARREDQASRLRVVEQAAPARRPRLLYGLIAVAGAIAIAGAQIGLSILTTQGTYEIRELTAQKKAVSWQVQILHDEVAGLGSPQLLAANAAALGMVTGQMPSYLALSTGEIVGSGKPASSTSSVQALKKAAVGNALVSDLPLVTDAKTRLGAGAAESTVVVSVATVPAVADGLPTPETH